MIGDDSAEAHGRRAPKVSLVGQMGSGKSSVAVRLADLWRGAGFRALDLDHAIEAAAGQRVAQIFGEHGEAHFRALEARVLGQVLASAEPLVLATGGGAPCSPGAMASLKAAGPVVWLAAPPEVLAARALDPSRPLLSGMEHEAAVRFLTAQLEARRPFYGEADVIVDAAQPLDEVVAAIARRVSARDLINPGR